MTEDAFLQKVRSAGGKPEPLTAGNRTIINSMMLDNETIAAAAGVWRAYGKRRGAVAVSVTLAAFQKLSEADNSDREESYNPFDDVFFWIQLACTDFSSVFCGEGTKKEPDARRSEQQADRQEET
ncbi:MAG: hypothetical protein LBK08_04925 [Treponema sp.]|jgi:hypothetical protein|nr:hypothetical protein [Treponema sp.]